mmetsp:Transcript_15643/g.16235  ORF Transcript_15643/g.16235 Transcript_15643/m.16235 type:complete len:213 (-) Transcript_15643:124-762(-)
MKFHPSTITLVTLLILASYVVSSSKKGRKLHLKKTAHKSHNNKAKQVNVVHDTNNFGSDIGVVVRKTPSVFVENRYGAPLLEPPQETASFSNSNTSNYPNVGGYGKSPEIVNPTILFNAKDPTTIVKMQPAHLGYRNEKTTMTQFNKRTGKMETHDIIDKKPVYGEIESVKTMNVNHIKQYDLQYRRFRKPRNVVQENPEFTLNRDERYVNE